ERYKLEIGAASGAREDGEADLWRKRHAIRYLAYVVVGPPLIFVGLYHHPLWWLLPLGGAAVYLSTPYRRLRSMIRDLPLRDKIKAILWAPIIRLWGTWPKWLAIQRASSGG
ncbi:MAG: hypothetical protein GTO63_18365, partial [Anaerolineae bacterium]|nr:hypothetical protein [Anaerolineae bacterium]NIN96735.1 hypothetical protein [Anaerolineae bacterium]NIQ79731.1 hypothetical protein [Anaerolineae bacterium]